MALCQTIYYFLDSEIVATYSLRAIYGLLRIVNMEVRGTIWRRSSTMTIQYTFTPVWIVKPVLSLVTGYASLLYYSYIQLRRFLASWKTGSPLILLSHIISPFLLYSFSPSFFFFQVQPPADYTKTTGFLLSRWRLAMRLLWFLSRAVKMHVSCINPYRMYEIVLLMPLQNNLLLLITNFSLH